MLKKGIVKEIGKGYCIIVDKDLNEYKGLEEDLLTEVKVKDVVTFMAEVKEKGDFKVLRAFFVERVEK